MPRHLVGHVKERRGLLLALLALLAVTAISKYTSLVEFRDINHVPE